jgi:hypothetical protein
MSYDGKVFFGLLADKGIDVDAMAEALEGELEDMRLEPV